MFCPGRWSVSSFHLKVTPCSLSTLCNAPCRGLILVFRRASLVAFQFSKPPAEPCTQKVFEFDEVALIATYLEEKITPDEWYPCRIGYIKLVATRLITTCRITKKNITITREILFLHFYQEKHYYYQYYHVLHFYQEKH